MARKIDIDIEAAQCVGAEHAVELHRESALEIKRRDANPSPRYRHSGYCETLQLDLAGPQTAGNSLHLSREFDAGAACADPMSGVRRQYCRLRSCVEKQSYRSSIRKQCDERRILHRRNRRLPEANRAAGAGGDGKTGTSGRHQCDHDCTAEPSCPEKLVHNSLWAATFTANPGKENAPPACEGNEPSRY